MKEKFFFLTSSLQEWCWDNGMPIQYGTLLYGMRVVFSAPMPELSIDDLVYNIPKESWKDTVWGIR